MKKYSYEIMVILLTIVLPLLSVLINWLVAPIPSRGAFFQYLTTWTVFWGIGVRLLIAGVSQIIRPSFTSKIILGNKTDEANQVVRELGFANFGIGLAGILSLWIPGFFFGAALIGGLFLGFDAIEHLRKHRRNLKENIALVTDLFVAVVALSLILLALYFFLMRIS